jgi:hypothetical protein
MFDVDEVNKLISEIQYENPDYIAILQKNLDDRNLFPAYSKTENIVLIYLTYTSSYFGGIQTH